MERKKSGEHTTRWKNENHDSPLELLVKETRTGVVRRDRKSFWTEP